MEEKEKLAEEVNQTPEAVEETPKTAAEETPEAEEIKTEEPEALEPETVEEAAETVAETAEAEAVETAEEVIEEAPTEKKAKKEKVVFEKPAGPDEDFNWDAYEKGVVLSGKSHEELEKVYDETLNAIKDHEVAEGTVISINKREVVVNVGFKSDGIVPMSEFRYNPDLKVGDKVEVYIESQEDKKG